MKRSAPLRRHTPLAPVNRKRRQSEWQRAYGSKKRVAFVKNLPCVVCRRTLSENAHIETDGMGRKAGADKIVPLCEREHRTLHRIGRDRFERCYDVDLEYWAKRTESLWQQHIGAPAPRCELCGRHEVMQYGLCSTCLTGKQGTHRRSA